jgi:hypothetical protein
MKNTKELMGNNTTVEIKCIEDMPYELHQLLFYTDNAFYTPENPASYNSLSDLRDDIQDSGDYVDDNLIIYLSDIDNKCDLRDYSLVFYNNCNSSCFLINNKKIEYQEKEENEKKWDDIINKSSNIEHLKVELKKYKFPEKL